VCVSTQAQSWNKINFWDFSSRTLFEPLPKASGPSGGILIAAIIYDKYATATKFTTKMDHASNIKAFV
jgi:hypothetical protein